MKALILNSGMGNRMGKLTEIYPKCMTDISVTETILSRQLRMLVDFGITDIVITTGKFQHVLMEYCMSLELPVKYTFVFNPEYENTNYIYSIYLTKDILVDEDIILMHGDLVFESLVLEKLIESQGSAMIVSSSISLPDKDFKAVIKDGLIKSVGIEFFNNAIATQPLYKLNKKDWNIWLDKIKEFCETDRRCVYAENALNEVTDTCQIKALDIRKLFCNEIDTPDDLAIVKSRIAELNNKTVYMCFSTDIVNSAHISIIKRAARYGRLIIGILSDKAVASYKRFPLLPFKERKILFENISGVYCVIEQKELSYKENLEKFKPDYVVHGDDWKVGFQKSVRDEVVDILASYGGCLIEFPYSSDKKFVELEKRARVDLALPDLRRSRLRHIINMKGLVTAIEAHSGITGLIAEKTVVKQEGKLYQFDAIWISSLCDSTLRGKPDIELVDITSRFRTINDIMEVTTKPIIFDGDTGGLIEHFVYTVKSLERIGVSMIIIEDKTGLKKNSLFGTDVLQTQDSIENFSAKIRAGKQSQKTQDFMIVARIESLILEKGMEDALNRAFSYVQAGADGIMIHSRKREAEEIFEFVNMFRKKDKITPLIVVPTTFNSVTEKEFKEHGINMVIYANHLTRSGFPAMQKTAEIILKNHRAKEADDMCMSIKDILTLIPDEF